MATPKPKPKPRATHGIGTAVLSAKPKGPVAPVGGPLAAYLKKQRANRGN